MSVFEKSKWIWIQNGDGQDMYADFVDTLEYAGEKTVINISCDSNYTLYVNGKYAASNQYNDFEHYKTYDTVDLGAFLTEGKNTLKITVYYCGLSTFRYKPAAAGLIYEIIQNGSVTKISDDTVMSRLSPSYVSGNKIRVTNQLGFSFEYDATKENEDGYAASVVVEKVCTFYPRPIKKAKLHERKPMKTVSRNDETHCLIDLGCEVVGFLSFDIFSETEQTVTISWGEHIFDGGVRKTVGGRNFWVKYKTKKGRNTFTDYMLSFGCRYVELFAEAPIDVSYAGIIPHVYETETLPVNIKDELDRRIYGVCVNTLNLCMMEHYVDCPWREQSLYAFDSRNQMLCGYFAFKDGNREYARANLKLIGMDRRDDGLLSICYPTGDSLAIPSFSLYYIFSMWEYVKYTGDITLAEEMYEKMIAIFEEYLGNRREDGLIKKFEGPKMWNFYDWSPHMNGAIGCKEGADPDTMANSVFILALERLEKICGSIGKDFPYVGIADSLREKIKAEFYDSERGAFTLRAGRDEYTLLCNAAAVLAGVVNGEEAARICEMAVNGELVDCSLSMKIFVYEALLMTDTEKYTDFVLSEIRNNYKTMLDYGSDTVWETIKGQSDFHNAGSLCHGWSAVPVYIFHKLGVAEYKKINHKETYMLKREEIRIRDPFILTDTENGCYYMYGTTALKEGSLGTGRFIRVYKSRDLESFDDGKIIFDGEKTNFWATRDYWAPEVHKYNGKYYLFVSFKSDSACRGTQILVSDTPDGEFKPISERPVTPSDWECLDGTFYEENGAPYIVFCHEWLQVNDGEIWAMPLSADLSKPAGDPFMLFKASDNPWVSEIKGTGSGKYVTDGPFMYRENGELKMIWSSFSEGKYQVFVVDNEGGIKGKWIHKKGEFEFDGGHAMIFNTLDGKRMISLHAPNTANFERAAFFEY